MSNNAALIAARSVHLKVFPQPASLGQSRGILKALQRFGHVEMYRSLKWDTNPTPDAAIAIFRDLSSAEKALNASPVRFSILSSEDSSLSESPPDSRESRIEFDLTIQPSTLNHADYISRQPYYSRYPATRHSVMIEDMKLKVPKGMKAMSELEFLRPEEQLRIRQRTDRMTRQVVDSRKTLKEMWEDGRRRRDAEEKASEKQTS